MKLKLKRRFLLLPTLLLGTVLTAACTDNEQTTNGSLKSKSTHQPASDTKNNKDQSETTNAEKKEVDQNVKSDKSTMSSKTDPKTSVIKQHEADTPSENPGSTTRSDTADTEMQNSQAKGSADSSKAIMHPEDNQNMPGTKDKNSGQQRTEGSAEETTGKPGEQEVSSGKDGAASSGTNTPTTPEPQKNGSDD